MIRKLSQWIDDVNFEIMMFFKFGSTKDGIFAKLIAPATVAFVTAILTVAWLHR